MESIDQQEVRVRIEDDTHGIYVGPEAIEVIRGEANRQADSALRAANELWDDLDVESLDGIKDMQFKVALLRGALDTLMYLAPLPDTEDE